MAETFITLLFMLVASNAGPVLAAWLLQSRCARPVDSGWQWRDRRPIFGPAKTWRGVIAALACACGLALVLGYGVEFGAVFGLLVVAGDLLSSFVKRRLAVAPSSRCLGLDQLPESFFPAAYAVAALQLPWWWAPLLSLAFLLVDMLVSRPLYLLKIRKRPY
jgi:CDP-2,3-bis-(O-geranylgeranyl)-sn-glycerol synthase